MSAATEISSVKQLVVEGRDVQRVFGALLDEMKMTGVQVHDFHGVSELASFIDGLAKSPGFRESVSSVGIVRDADSRPASSFQSVQSAVRKLGWAVPSQPMASVGSNPKVTVLLLPGVNRKGMLEDLLLEGVADDPVMPCVDTFMECVAQRSAAPPKVLSKARAHAFLSSRERANLQIGEAAQKGYWQLGSRAYDEIRAFLHLL